MHEGQSLGITDLEDLSWVALLEKKPDAMPVNTDVPPIPAKMCSLNLLY